MRKDQLLYLHHLLALLRVEFERRGVADGDAFAAYDALDSGPMAVHAPKREHARAVKALAAGLATAIEDSEGRDQVVPSA